MKSVVMLREVVYLAFCSEGSGKCAGQIWRLRFYTRSWDNSGYVKTWIRRSWSSKVADFGTNHKCIYDFLLTCNGNFGPTLCRFSDSAGFCPPEWLHPYFTPILGMFPLHQIAHLGVSLSYSAVKLFSKNSNLCDCNTLTSQTDGQTTSRSISALCVESRGEKLFLCSMTRWIKWLTCRWITRIYTVYICAKLLDLWLSP